MKQYVHSYNTRAVVNNVNHEHLNNCLHNSILFKIQELNYYKNL